jgi:hypothetical protein
VKALAFAAWYFRTSRGCDSKWCRHRTDTK